ncbi:MAG TPA: hypothetical protein VD994_21685 [Prosthecobacter sp.]|nr:hypothetical protein [Prosthecobacter sp.]
MKLRLLTFLCALLLAGCGKDPSEVVDSAGQSFGEHVTDLTKAIGKGVDNKLIVKVSLAPEVEALGLTSTTAKSHGLDSGKKELSIYLIASKDVSTTLMAQAYNAEAAEIGRSKKPVKLAKDDAAYFVFEFDEEMDSNLVKEYKIVVRDP